MGDAARAGPRGLTASGLRNISETPPGAGRATSRELTMNPASVRQVTSRPAAAAGRQRRDGSPPEGKNRSIAARPAKAGMKSHSASAPTTRGAGSVPGWVVIPVTA